MLPLSSSNGLVVAYGVCVCDMTLFSQNCRGICPTSEAHHYTATRHHHHHHQPITTAWIPLSWLHWLLWSGISDTNDSCGNLSQSDCWNEVIMLLQAITCSFSAELSISALALSLKCTNHALQEICSVMCSALWKVLIRFQKWLTKWKSWLSDFPPSADKVDDEPQIFLTFDFYTAAPHSTEANSDGSGCLRAGAKNDWKAFYQVWFTGVDNMEGP